MTRETDQSPRRRTRGDDAGETSPPLDIAIESRAGGETTATLGGAWALDETSHVLFVVDARGRASEAAIAAMRTDELHRELFATTDADTIVSRLLARFDARSSRLDDVVAGLVPAFAARADGSVTDIARTGTALAAVEQIGCRSQSVQLLRGDTLFVVTAGALNTPNESAELLEGHVLRQHAAAHAGELGDTAGVASALMRDIRAFSGESADRFPVTILVARVG